PQSIRFRYIGQAGKNLARGRIPSDKSLGSWRMSLQDRRFAAEGQTYVSALNYREDTGLLGPPTRSSTTKNSFLSFQKKFMVYSA
ncbi:hypothetical protein VU12_12025, partial [Desulfobulbus sp. US4]|nr:hypothetical protein [Desulfobulbus sp. US4]